MACIMASMPAKHPNRRTLTARWVFPVSGPPIPHGIVTICDDLIEAVSESRWCLVDEDLGNAAILPGLVNPHTHLDLSGARGLIPPTDPEHFTDWLRAVIAYRRSRSAEEVAADIRTGLAEAMRFGTTLLGDISAEGQSWDALAAAPLRAMVFRELIGLSDERAKAAWSVGKAWHAKKLPAPDTRRGLSPHAPYSARHSLITGLSRRSICGTIHLAESPAEMELLAHRSGPFVDFLKSLGVWDPTGLIGDVRSVLTGNRDVGKLLLAHCNYIPLPDVACIGFDMSVVYCPRTHAAFRHPPHPFRELQARGVRVCLGTDGLTSNPDLDPLAEARFVHRRYPDLPGDVLLTMITFAGAEALGWADKAGCLEPGKSADLVVVPLPDQEAADPHDLLFADHPGDRRTMFRGQWRE